MPAIMYVAVPTHSETIHTCTAVALLDLMASAPARNAKLHIVFHNASVISHLRNTVVADFLAGPYDLLFMLDSDQGLSHETVWRMVESGHPVVGCIYPRRNFRWSEVPPNLSSNDMPNILYHASRFVGSLKLRPDGSFDIQNGFARAEAVGTGALLVHRKVLETMKQHFPELKGQGFPIEDENLPRAENNWGFFNPLVAAQDGRNAGEDIGFCHRWQQCGGEIWADIISDTTHLGRYAFRGNYLQFLRSKGIIQFNPT